MHTTNRLRPFWLNPSELRLPVDQPMRWDKNGSRNGDGAVPSQVSIHTSSFPASGHTGFVVPLDERRPPTFEEVRFHSQLSERLRNLRRERRGFWSKIWHYVWGD